MMRAREDKNYRRIFKSFQYLIFTKMKALKLTFLMQMTVLTTRV
jgi:hypothetical protein